MGKAKEVHVVNIVIRFVFNDGNIYYPPVSLVECISIQMAGMMFPKT